MSASSASSREQPLPSDDRYAPEISILVGGQEVPLRDVIDLRVTLQRDDVSGFSMLLANPWELERDGESGKGSFRHSDQGDLDVFKAVEIRMGYASGAGVVPMFIGEIITLAPSFPSSGLPTLQITGTDPLGRLRRSKPEASMKKAWEHHTDGEIVEQIAKRYHLPLAAGSGKGGTSRPITNQRDMDDLRFLLSLAKRNDYEAVIVVEGGKPALYFGSPRDRRGPKPTTERVLTWGESLISFSPRLTVGRQVSKVTVRGWDPRKKEPIEYTAKVEDLRAPGRGKTGAELLEERAGAKTERIVDGIVQHVADAKALAIQLLADTANQFLTGRGETIGDPAIVPETIVDLRGLGERYDGPYKVIKADHVYGANGYTTAFEVERMRAGK
jgi:phage protein D